MVFQRKDSLKFRLLPTILGILASAFMVASGHSATVDDDLQPKENIPAPAYNAPDFRNLLPAAPPGLGKVSNHLVFFSNGSGDNPQSSRSYELYRVDLDRSNLTQLTHSSAAILILGLSNLLRSSRQTSRLTFGPKNLVSGMALLFKGAGADSKRR